MKVKSANETNERKRKKQFISFLIDEVAFLLFSLLFLFRRRRLAVTVWANGRGKMRSTVTTMAESSEEN